MKSEQACLVRCLLQMSNVSQSFTTQDKKASLCAFSPIERESHQKVAAFSFFGDVKGVYFDGIKDNLDLMKVSIFISKLV